MCVNCKRRAFAHREQPGHRIDLAVAENHACDRRVAQLSLPRMKLRRCDQLLAQVRRSVDQEPVIAVCGQSDRALRASQFRLVSPGRAAYRTSAIPLRNSAARCGSQDDDAKHDPSPGLHSKEKQNETKSESRTQPIPAAGTSCVRSFICFGIEAIATAYLRAAQAYMLISMPTGTSTILGAFQAILALLFGPPDQG